MYNLKCTKLGLVIAASSTTNASLASWLEVEKNRKSLYVMQNHMPIYTNKHPSTTAYQDSTMEKLDYDGKLTTYETKDLVEILSPFEWATNLAQAELKVTPSVILTTQKQYCKRVMLWYSFKFSSTKVFC